MRSHPRRGFTVTELLVVIGVITLLLGLIFPALGAFRQTGLMSRSMSHLRQIGAWMKIYAGDNRDFVVPSQFDYSGHAYPGKVRSRITMSPLPVGREHAGTWADILWTVNGLGPIPEAGASELEHDFAFDSPDGYFTEWAESALPRYVNPLRSAAGNTRDFRSAHDLATPFGPGAGEQGRPGYFAANNFFNADAGAICPRNPGRSIASPGFITYAQIRRPERSMYLVDCFTGEVIQAWPEHYEVVSDPAIQPPPDESRVDFRYNDSCLMLFLDSHVEAVARWDTIEDLEGPGGLGIRIRRLDER